ncbi:MAG: hypothetical protein AAF653_10075, partial [Chloroflexota bacterium]
MLCHALHTTETTHNHIMAQDTQHHTLSDRLRNHTANFTRNVGESVHRLGIHPDAVSVAALL